MKMSFLCAITVIAFNLNGQVLTGIISNDLGSPISNARVTLFNNDTSLFRETRTDLNGRYVIDNLPGGGPYLFFGVSSLGKEYFQNTTTGIIDTLEWNTVLLPETNTGNWEIIMESPEPLGGTDLGVLMPDGTIYYCHSTKDPFYFDPVTNDTIFAKGDVSIQGCVGPLQTDDGKVWFMGGTLQEIYGPGTRKVKFFDPSDSSWGIKPNMLDYRWYPTVAMLPSGKFLIAGGGNLDNPVRTNSSEIYDPATGQSVFTNDLAIGNEVSPIVVLYNGKVLMTHRPPQLFDSETNQWDVAGDFVQGPRMPNGDHSDCELVLMPDGEAIAIGYKSFTPDHGTFIERYDPDMDAWSLGTSIPPVRSRAKTCLLPDKKILVMGGFKEDNTIATVNQWGYMKLTDLYNPREDSWRRLDDLNYFREYHALTILVPDGRVIAVGGEGAPGNEPPFSVIEAFHPPYLFKGIRPEIDSLYLSSFARGAKIELDFSKTDSVTEVILMSNAVVTHFMNSGNNRYLALDYTQSGKHIIASLPRDSVKLIPGFYMFFIMVDDIPSIGRIVQIRNEVVEDSIGTAVDQVEHNEIVLAPNPGSGKIKVIGADNHLKDIKIYDNVGNLIFHGKGDHIDMHNFPAGFYYAVLILDENKSITKGFIKL